VSADGYGNALYIEHPNGLVSVYAHLQSFIPVIADLVLKKQYELQEFEVDFSPKKDLIQLSGGQIIGMMGSTGHSFGPHLHFEIREKESEKMLNPLIAAFAIEDQTEPTLQQIKIYHLDHRFLSYNSEVLDPLATNHDTLEIDAWRVGFGVETFDPHNRGLNRNGIYGLELYLDDNLLYGFKMDALSFEDCSFYDAHLDCESKNLDGHTFHTCYRKTGNHANIYYGQSRVGIIPLFRDRLQKVRIKIMDYAGNQKDWSLHLRRTTEVTPAVYPTFHHLLKYDEENVLHQGNLRVKILEGSLLENSYANLVTLPDSATRPFPVYQIHRSEVPLRKGVEIAIGQPAVEEHLKAKTLIANISNVHEAQLLPSRWKQDTLIATSSEFGIFTISFDTIPPTINVIKNQLLGDRRSLRFKIRDINKYEGQAAKLKYTVSVDDQWHLASYDLKSDQIECELLRKNYQKGEHLLKLVVSDYVGNQTTYDYRFNFN